MRGAILPRSGGVLGEGPAELIREVLAIEGEITKDLEKLFAEIES